MSDAEFAEVAKELDSSIKTLQTSHAREKERFIGPYGKQDGYTPSMGSNMNGKACRICGKVKKRSLGDGQVYYCPECQN
jgi:formamidopyrimidine-DNA glycosylase